MFCMLPCCPFSSYEESVLIARSMGKIDTWIYDLEKFVRSTDSTDQTRGCSLCPYVREPNSPPKPRRRGTLIYLLLLRPEVVGEHLMRSCPEIENNILQNIAYIRG